jgi:hypothetical protein
MVRNMDLIREILLKTEEVTPDKSMNYNLLESKDKISEQEYIYHVMLLKEAGYIDAILKPSEGDILFGGLIKRLTWEGHEFLDNIREQSVWNKVKDKIKSHGGTVSVSLLTELAKNLMRNALS